MIPPEYDSMIAKVIASGSDRDEALARLRRALAQMVVIVRGGTTNKSFLLDLLERPEVRRGEIDTGWLDRLTAAGAHTRHRATPTSRSSPPPSTPPTSCTPIDRSRFLGWASRGRPQLDAGRGHEIELRHGAYGVSPSTCAAVGPQTFVLRAAEPLARRRRAARSAGPAAG